MHKTDFKISDSLQDMDDVQKYSGTMPAANTDLSKDGVSSGDTDIAEGGDDVIEFKVDDAVIYPSHGVGKITGVEKQEIAGYSMELYAISFSEDNMILRVPKSRAVKAGLRGLCGEAEMKEAVDALRKPRKDNRGMWSKRAQEYDTKINSGNIVKLAEVVRDLFKLEDPDRSYSERVVYDLALDRFIAEYSIVTNLSKEESLAKVLDILETASILTAA